MKWKSSLLVTGSACEPAGQLALVTVQVLPGEASVQLVSLVPLELEMVALEMRLAPWGSLAILMVALVNLLRATLVWELLNMLPCAAVRRKAVARWRVPVVRICGPETSVAASELSEFCGKAMG